MLSGRVCGALRGETDGGVEGFRSCVRMRVGVQRRDGDLERRGMQ